MARKLGNIYLKLAERFVYRKLPAKSAATQWTYVIHGSDDVDCSGSETEMSRSFWMQMIIRRNNILDANKDCMHLVFNC